MTGYEAWIGNCHLRGVGGGADGDPSDGGEYRCQAAVWADGGETFRTRLAAHVAKQGYAILWLEEVLSAANYLSRHGNQHKIGPLARAVHAGHPVALSRLTALGAAGVPAEPESYLTIEEIEGVEPLDLQAGVHPRKTVPDSLREPLFGQLEPSEAEITQYGSAEAVPPLKTYAILDAAKFQWGLSEIAKCDLPYRCLFKGDAAAELKDVAPYLIELDPEADFTRRLFTHDPDMPDHMTGVHLWHKEPGIYIRSRAGFDALWKHFRKFTKVQREDSGQWVFFGFYDPSILRTYLRNVPGPQQLSFLREHAVTVCTRDGAAETYRIDPAFMDDRPARIRYSHEAIAAFEKTRARVLAERLVPVLVDDYGDYNPLRGDALLDYAQAAMKTAKEHDCVSDLSCAQFVAALFVLNAAPGDGLSGAEAAVMNNRLVSAGTRAAALLQHALDRQRLPAPEA